MRKTPMELAAMASAAVPGLAPAGVSGAPDDAADFTSAVVIDDAGKQWRVRSPRHPEASMRLETELLVLRSFSPGIRAELPFQVPSVAGTVQQGELRTFVYNHVPGATLELETLVAEGGRVPTEIGRAMAGIHDLPQAMVDRADLPSYTADEFRQRRLNELDQAATTGKIPPALLRRWEHALEDVTLWKFNPSVVHGDLHEDNLVIWDGAVSAVTGWTDLRIGDPADDFAWLIAVHEQSFADVVLESYNKYRKEPVDPHLMRRAALAAEFALAQWLVRGVAAEDAAMIAEAEEMLQELESDIREHGGQEISSEKLPVPVAPAGPPSAAPETERPAAGPRISERVTAEPIVRAVPSDKPAAGLGPVDDTDTRPDNKETDTDKESGDSGLQPPKEDAPTADQPHASADAKPKTAAEKNDGDASDTGTAAADESLITTAIPVIEPRSGS
ncbi:macrolide 2'-phosphotransferase [Arthrobacter crystallopoietes]|uniref:macrolide 2'-phosphotransferase n=1 Tax=Crystallibacter crystallopoietes TaxID=37928 RepID=UPI001ABE3A11|nr:macrolide 2'-phosphotransferase [Arthrobacter crystallopoietes]QTG80670.1 macrolide 2'-phosphotransferase [Arthrobacter crystallopoietes]